MDFRIDRSWDNRPISHEPVKLSILPCTTGIKILIDAPYHGNCPVPPGDIGKPCANLWDYEVVEAFFSNEEDLYLEVELSPHGQHLLLLLHGCRNCIQDQFPIEYNSSINEDSWHGEAIIPSSYFPPKVTRFNAFAIHGTDVERRYEALYPVPCGKYSDPDFHRLEYFQPIDISQVLPENCRSQQSSEEWKKALTETP